MKPCRAGGPERVDVSFRTLATTTIVLMLASGTLGTNAARAADASSMVSGQSQLVTYDASAGEANDLTASVDEASVMFSERGGHVTARAGCSQVDPGMVSCPRSDPTDSDAGGLELRIRLADGDDRAALRSSPSLEPSISVWAGPGDDRVDASGM